MNRDQLLDIVTTEPLLDDVSAKIESSVQTAIGQFISEAFATDQPEKREFSFSSVWAKIGAIEFDKLSILTSRVTSFWTLPMLPELKYRKTSSNYD